MSTPREERTALLRAVRLLDLDRRRLVWAVLAGSAGLASAVALTATAAWLIARASQMPSVGQLAVAAVSVRLFGTSRAALRYVERLASHKVALEGMGALRESVYTSLAGGRAGAVTSLRRGDLLARTGADIDAVGDVVVRALVPAAVATLVGVGSVVLVGWQHVGVGLVLAACLVVAGVVGPALSARAARLSEQAQLVAHSEISSTAMTMVDGAGELAVSGRLPGMVAELRRTERTLTRAKDTAARPAALAAGIDTLAMGIAVLGAVILGVPAMLAGTMQPVELAVIVLTPLAAFEGTALLGPAARQLVRSGGAAVRIMALLDSAAGSDGAQVDTGHVSKSAMLLTPAQHAEPALAGSAEVGANTRPDLAGSDAPAADARLRVRGLAVGWPGGPVVARGIDLDLAPGRAIAVVGPSGAGKTTLLLTLAGLLAPRAGEVSLAGRALWGAPREGVSSQIVLTAEDAHIFETTVLENLRVARGDLTPAGATALLGRAELGAWLAALPDGLDTMLGSNATTISGGERRRLLLARALASRAPLLLLDEPGEHLDPGAADRLVTDLLHTAHDGAPADDQPRTAFASDDANEPGARGVVLVTHRLAALTAADEVLLLGDGGTVVACGTHARLVEHVPEYAWAVAHERSPVDHGPVAARPDPTS